MWVSNHVPVTVDARTWYVKQDGTGDAPTIAAAVDSSALGDTILVAKGMYEIGEIDMKNGVVLMSESGPYETKLVPEPMMYPPCAISFENVDTHTELNGFWIDGFIWAPGGSGAIYVEHCDHLYFRNNIFTNNEDAAIVNNSIYMSLIYIENNTFVNNNPYAIIGGTPTAFITHNIIWGRAHSITGSLLIECNCMLDTSDSGDFESGNTDLDPQFCGTVESGNLFVQSDSPCASGNAPPPLTLCGLLGALPVGCGDTPIRSASWGELKRLYR
jgi:hypothetical protein